MNEMQKTILQNNLRDLRHSSGLTQKQIAQKLFIARSSWANYESGKRIPTIDMLQKIAALFNVSMDYLFGLSDDVRNAVPVSIDNDIKNEIIHNRYLDILKLPANQQVALLEYYKYLCRKDS